MLNGINAGKVMCARCKINKKAKKFNHNRDNICFPHSNTPTIHNPAPFPGVTYLPYIYAKTYIFIEYFPTTPEPTILSQTIISRYRNAPYRTEVHDFQDDIYGVRLYYIASHSCHSVHSHSHAYNLDGAVRIVLREFHAARLQTEGIWCHLENLKHHNFMVRWGVWLFQEKITRSRFSGGWRQKGSKTKQQFFFLSHIKLITKKCVCNYARVLASNFVLRNLIYKAIGFCLNNWRFEYSSRRRYEISLFQGNWCDEFGNVNRSESYLGGLNIRIVSMCRFKIYSSVLIWNLYFFH